MIAFATDEDLALRASSDFLALCPRDQTLTSGTDGILAAGDRWTLASPSVDFVAAGLQPGQLVHLIRPSSAFGPSGPTLAIDRVTPSGIVLRRKGQGPGLGQPPGPASGVVGVEFSVRTLGPQILRAGLDVIRRLGIEMPTASPEIREAVLLTVLYRQFLDQSRQFSGTKDAPDDWYAAKARMIKAELDEHLSGLALRWASTAAGAGEAIRFGTRISR